MRPLLVTASPVDGHQNANVHCLQINENIFLCQTWTVFRSFYGYRTYPKQKKREILI